MNQGLPLISIITPVYNGAQYLEQLIQSVYRQNYPNTEHIIIDDGSTDSGATVAILKQHSHLRWWSRENQGQYATMNEGLEAAKGELVCFISADDLMLPEALRRAVDFMQIHPEHEGVYGAYQWIDENDFPQRAQRHVDHAPLSLFRYAPFIAHCSLYVKRDRLISRKLYFDSSLHYVGDYDWLVRLIAAGFKLGYLGQALSSVRSHPARTSHRLSEPMAAERIRVFKRHGVNIFLFSGIDLMIYYFFAAQRWIDTVRTQGLRGARDILRRWYRRRKGKQP